MTQLHLSYDMLIEYSVEVQRCNFTIKCIPTDTLRQKIKNIKIQITPEVRYSYGKDGLKNIQIYGVNEEAHKMFNFHIEALASRFMVIQMPVISIDNLQKLICDQFPSIKTDYAKQFAVLFDEIRKKTEEGEISTKALDLRGLLAAIRLTNRGLAAGKALELGMANKCFDAYERQLVLDLIAVRIPGNLGAESIFNE